MNSIVSSGYAGTLPFLAVWKSRFQSIGRTLGSTSLFAVVAALACGALSSKASAASIVTDQHDYPPNSVAVIYGSGFQANETVTLVVHHDDPNTPEEDPWDIWLNHEPWTVSADANGSFVTSWYVASDCLGATLKATATGMSSNLVATTTFTDASSVGNLELWFNRSGGWGGTANGTNSGWKENDAVPMRWSATLVGSTTYRIYIQHDFKKDAPDLRHFSDAFYQFNLTTAGTGLTMPTEATVTSGMGVSGSPTTVVVPDDSSTTQAVTVPPASGSNDIVTNVTIPPQGSNRVIKIWGVSSATWVGYQTRAGSVSGSGDNSKWGVLDITVAGTGSQNVVMTYGAHLASRKDYGLGNGASRWPGGSGKFGVIVDEAADGLNLSGVTIASLQSAGILIEQTGTLAALEGATQVYGNTSFTLTITPKDADTGTNTNVAATFTVLSVSGGTANLAGTTITNVQTSGGTTTATLTLNGTGTAQVQANIPANSTYTSATASAAFTVTPRPITITASNGSKTYGTTFTPTAYSVTGLSPVLWGSETISSVTLTSTKGPDASAAVGTYVGDIVAGAPVTGANGFNAGNYAITYNPGDLSVTKGTVTISVTPYHVTYDGVEHAATGTATGPNGENLNSMLDLSGTKHTNAGDYPTDAWTFTDTTGNYNNASGTVHDIIDKANATVVVTPYTVTYDGNAHTATVTSITGVAGQTGATVGTVTLNSTHTAAGTYSSDSWSFTGTANYNNIASTTITDVINKANATVVVTPYTVTYDGNAHTATVTSITGVNGETGSTVGTVTLNSTHTNAGTYSSDSWSFTGAANYNDIASTTITDVINKANATVVVTPYTVTYDGQPHSATVTSITGVNGETGATVGTVTLNSTHTNAGTYSSDSWSFTGAANYNNIASTTITDVINKANATVVVTPYTVTYDGNPHSATVTSITGVNGETGATVGTVTLNSTHTNAGTYSSDSWSFTGAANYNNIASTTITDVINKANATVVVTPYTVTYDGNPHSATVTSITGVAGQTGATVGTVTLNSTHTNVGTYSSDSWSFTGAANYNNIGSTTITDVINKANATVVVTPYTVTYDGQPHSATVTSITGVNGETGATVGSVTLNSTHTAAGTYSSDSWSFTGTANYNNIASTTITDVINKANATVVVTPYTVTYDANPHSATVTSITGVNGETGATVGTVTLNSTHTNAGTYSSDSWSFTGAANYNNIASTTITDTINKANAVVVVAPYNVVYDGVAHTATVTSITGVAGQTGATVGTVTLNSTHTNPGTYSSDSWSFTGTGNYNNIGSTTITDIITKGTASGTLHGVTDQGTDVGGTTGNLLTLTSWAGQAVTLRADVTGTGATPTGSVIFYQFTDSALFASYSADTEAGREATKAIPGMVGTINFTTGVITPAGAKIINLNASAGISSPLNGSGQGFLGPLNYPILNAGAHLLAFDYSGDSNYLKFDPVMNWGVDQIPTTTVVTHSASPTYGTPITFTAVVTSSLPQYGNFGSSAYPGHVFVEGSVVFKDNGTAFATVAAAGNGQTDGTLKVTATRSLPVGSGHVITAEYSDVGVAYAYGSSTGTDPLTVDKAPSTTTVILEAGGPTFTAACRPFGADHAEVSGYNLSIPSFTPIWYVGTGSTTYGPSQIKPMLNGSYKAYADYPGDADHYGSHGEVAFSISGTAGPGTTSGTLYTGSLFFWTTGPSSSTASLALSCTVADIGECKGDIRGATVTFWASNDGTNFKKIGNATDLPVGLVDPTKTDVGTASALSQWNMQSNNDVESFILKITVGGTYHLATDYTYVVTVSKPLPGTLPGQTVTSLVGGGTVKNGPVGGAPASSGYLGNNPSLTNDTGFHADVKYNKSLTNPQGKVTVLIHSFNRPDGSVDSVEHTYIATSNAISELTMKPGKLPMISFSSKVTLKEILSNGSTTSLDAGNMLQITLVDGNPDYVGIQIQKSAGAGGGLWYSSSWGPATVGELPSTLLKATSGGDVVAGTQ